MKNPFKPDPEKISLRDEVEKLLAGIPEFSLHGANPAFDTMRGAHALRRAGNGEDFWQFRDYHAGDALGRIDWRRSGRSDGVYVREKERQARQTFLLWAAQGRNMNFRSQSNLPTKSNAANILVLAFGILMAQHGEKINWLEAQDRNTGGNAVDNLENRLLETGEEKLLPEISGDVQNRSRIVLAGDFINPVEDTEAIIAPLSANCPGGVLIQILDPLEADINLNGRILFEEPASSRNHLVNQASLIRDAYKERIESHRESLRMMCEAHGWHYLFHRTNESLRDTLLALWQITNGKG